MGTVRLPKCYTYMRKKILLINPEKKLHPPFGLLYLASSLEKAGFTPDMIEIPQSARSFENKSAFVHEKIVLLDPCFIGITCMSAQAPLVKQLAAAIKKSFPDIKIVIGGVHPTTMPYQVMNWGADYVVSGEGEHTMVELAGHVIHNSIGIEQIKGVHFRKGNDVIFTGERGFITNLDELPRPAYQLSSRERFTKRKGEIRGTWLRCAWIMTSRGCPSRCTFCAGHSFFGKTVRERSLDNIFSELDFLVKEFRIEAFYLLDDTFIIKKDRVIKFCERLKGKYPGLRWGCQARVNFFDETIARALKNSGCIQVDFGVESGSQRILDLLKKGIKVQQTRKAFLACRKYGLKTLATIMIGNPTETLEDVNETRQLLREITPDFVAVYYTTPFPGTELYNLAREKGFVSDEKVENEFTHQLIKPLPWSCVDDAVWETVYNEFSKWNIVENYLLNPFFVFDMSRFSVRHPVTAGKIMFLFLRGNRKDAFQLLTEKSFDI